MSKISELAKEWGVEPKAVVAATVKLGLKGKRPTSKLEDDEVVRVRQELGLPGVDPALARDRQHPTGREDRLDEPGRLEEVVLAGLVRHRRPRP